MTTPMDPERRAVAIDRIVAEALDKADAQGMDPAGGIRVIQTMALPEMYAKLYALEFTIEATLALERALTARANR